MHERSIRVLGLVPYPPGTTPSQRFRLEQWMPRLAEQGITLELRPFVSDELMPYLHKAGRTFAKAVEMARAVAGRVADVIHSSRYDAVVVHRAACLAGPAWIERALRWRNVPVIFDFDDAIYQAHSSPGNRAFSWLKFPGKTATVCRLSDVVVAGSEYLAQYARRHSESVRVVPTSIDTAVYDRAARHDRARDQPIVVGWTGSSTSMKHLELFTEMLRTLTRNANVELRVQSNEPPRLPGVPHVYRSWDPRTEVDEIAMFDIGIKPMPDDAWSRGKCPMKELQYMALGIATVSSDVGTAREIIRHGENGLLATTTDEWLAGVTRLAADSALRRRLGDEGRRTVAVRYSMTACADLFAQAVREAVASHREAAS